MNVDPATCASLGVFRWGIDQLYHDIDYQNLFHIEVDDSSFESKEGVHLVDGHLSFHEPDVPIQDFEVFGNTSSASVSSYSHVLCSNVEHCYCTGSAASIDAGKLSSPLSTRLQNVFQLLLIVVQPLTCFLIRTCSFLIAVLRV